MPGFSLHAPCPCGSGRDDAACCLPLLRGAPAETAEALMRSRYTAHVRHDADHLLATWHPRTRPADVEFGIEEWLGLEVRDVVDGGADDEAGEVAFEARYRDGTGDHVLAERSSFVRHRRRWVYVDGV